MLAKEPYLLLELLPRYGVRLAISRIVIAHRFSVIASHQHSVLVGNRVIGHTVAILIATDEDRCLAALA